MSAQSCCEAVLPGVSQPVCLVFPWLRHEFAEFWDCWGLLRKARGSVVQMCSSVSLNPQGWGSSVSVWASLEEVKCQCGLIWAGGEIRCVQWCTGEHLHYQQQQSPLPSPPPATSSSKVRDFAVISIELSCPKCPHFDQRWYGKES